MKESEQKRLIEQRLAIIRHAEEVSKNTAKTCRYYGISRSIFYYWYRRYQKEGIEGLRNHSCRPKHSPRATSAETVGKIVYLRQHYHFGPWKIQMYLERYHGIKMSKSGICKILQRLGLGLLPRSQRYRRHKERWKRYEKAQPGHRLQIDVKFLERIPDSRQRYYQFTAIDDCTRLRVLKIYDRCNQQTAIQFVDYVLSRFPFHVQAIQTDNGAEFQQQFHWHILDKGIQHSYIKPATPRLNGKVERSHRIDQEEFYQLLEGKVIDNAQLFNDKLKEWENYYNFQRPHGSLSGQTPYERFKQKTETLSV